MQRLMANFFIPEFIAFGAFFRECRCHFVLFRNIVANMFPAIRVFAISSGGSLSLAVFRP